MSVMGQSVRDKPLLISARPIWGAAGRDWSGGGKSVAWRRAVMRATARQIVAEKGVEGLHMRNLADRCDIAVQTLYNNFGGRDAILLSAVAEHCEANLARVWDEAGETDGNPILVAAELATRLAAADAPFMRELFNFFERSGACHPLAATSIRLYTQSHLRALRRTEARDGLRPWVDCEAAVNALQRLMISMLSELVNLREDDRPRRAEAAMEYRMAIGIYLLGLTQGEEADRLEQLISGGA